jgi:hypothetical protein
MRIRLLQGSVGEYQLENTLVAAYLSDNMHRAESGPGRQARP